MIDARAPASRRDCGRPERRYSARSRPSAASRAQHPRQERSARDDSVRRRAPRPLDGLADQALLDSYHDERQPAGRATEQSLDNSLSMGRLGTSPTVTARPEYLNTQGMIFGTQYASTAVLPDGTPAPVVANPVTEYVASARPGGRAPQVALNRNG